MVIHLSLKLCTFFSVEISNLQILHSVAPLGSQGKRICYAKEAKILNGRGIIFVSENSLGCRKANDLSAVGLVKHLDIQTQNV